MLLHQLEALVNAPMIGEAVLTRWNTIRDASEWKRKYGAAYARLCAAMYDGADTSTTREMYGMLVSSVPPCTPFV